MSERTQRRLAAIVAVDVAGYSLLVGLDEEGTLRSLRTIRQDLVDPLLARHGGRVANTAGDSLLLEFPSVVDATHWAVALQQSLNRRGATAEPDNRLQFRIGIHIGDVVSLGDDLLGDGVNVAARLEGIAEAGGIALSDDAYRQVRDRIDINWHDAGEQELKNIARPVRVWRWNDGEPTPHVSPAMPAEPMAGQLSKPSVAVLPFASLSTDAEQEFFADGIAEDIITALSKISRMRVIARNSTFVYKGRNVDSRQVASELGVRYILEGSLRRGGKRLRIAARLIDAADGSHLWAERYDRTVDDIFDIQDEITKEIVTALHVQLTDGEVALVMARGTNQIEPWLLCVQATDLFMRFNTTDYLKAQTLAQQAVDLDPEYAYAWATLGFTHWWDGRLGYTGETGAKFALADELACKAMALDDTVSWALGLSAMVAAPLNRHDEGIEIGRRGVQLHPGNADLRAFFAFTLTHAGQNCEALEHYRAAIAMNPHYPNWYRGGLSRTLAELGEFEECLTVCDEILRVEPGFLSALLRKAYVFGRTGRREEAADTVRQIARLAPSLRVLHLPHMMMAKLPATTTEYVEILRAAGLPE